MDRAFKQFAKYLEKHYGVQFDKEEGFVVCPECGEPLYDCDWTVFDFSNEDDEYICPVCLEILEADSFNKDEEEYNDEEWEEFEPGRVYVSIFSLNP